ncbi:MAG TPA: hypothetical protein VFD73_12585 [Gemmatimonadales bacterium]|nr:hypothetical protein [Gemmatimonadales bacterium]
MSRILALLLLLNAKPLFGLTYLYVNTDAGSGGDGSVGSPWNHLRTAITASQTDTALAAGDVIVLYWGVTADNQNIVQTHWDSITTSPTSRLIIIGDSPTPGIYNTSAARIEGDGVNLLYNNAPGDVEIYNVQFKLINGNGSLNACRLATQNVGAGRTDNFCRISRCTFVLPNGGYATYNSNFADGASPAHGRIVVDNCVSYGGAFGSANTGVENYNNTVYGGADGFVDPQIVINCLAAGQSNKGFNNVGTGGGLSDYNASSDATAPGAHSRISQTFQFVDAAGGNAHLLATDTGAKDFGLSDPASGLFTNDVDNATRFGAWDIGADEVTTYWAPDATNSIDWGNHTGVPGGIPRRTTIAATLTSSATASQINSAVAAAASNTVVLLGAGFYGNVGGDINLASKAGVTLRGSGKYDTILPCAIYTDQYAPSSTGAAIFSGYTIGSTSIFMAATPNAAVQPGLLAVIAQDDDTNVVATTSGPARRMRFTVQIQSVSGTNVTFFPPLPMTMESRWSPYLLHTAFSGLGASMMGIEDLTVTNAASEDATIYFSAAQRCWMKNVRVLNGVNTFSQFLYSFQCEARDCDFRDAESFPANQDGYGVYLWEDSSWCRVEGCIFDRLAIGVLASSSSCNAVAYNYCGAMSFQFGQGWVNQTGGINANHGAHPMFNLFEGNVTEMFQSDGYHGSASKGTLLRNWLHGTNSLQTNALVGQYSANRKMISLERASYEWTAVGNILGDSSWTNDTGFVYQMSGGGNDYESSPCIWRLGYPSVANNGTNSGGAGQAPNFAAPYRNSYPDAKVELTLLRHGNYDFKTLSISNTAGLNTSIPMSLLYTNGPGTTGPTQSVTRWPAFDPSQPNLRHPTNIVAGLRFFSPASGGVASSAIQSRSGPGRPTKPR